MEDVYLIKYQDIEEHLEVIGVVESKIPTAPSKIRKGASAILIQTTKPKVGRNQKCECGCNRKVKHCPNKNKV